MRRSWITLAAVVLSCDGTTPYVPGAAPEAPPPEIPAPPPPVAAPGDPGACPIGLADLALYQGVKVPLVLEGQRLEAPGIDVVRRRPALVRAFVRLLQPGVEVDARARLRVRATAGEQVFEDARRIVADSHDRDLTGTFNFDLEPSALDGPASVELELLQPAACAGVRLPAAPIRPRRTGVLRVRLVPIRYDADGSGRLPDTSPEQLDRFRDLLEALYPVEAVEVTVRDAMASDIKLGTGGWTELLDAVRALRAQDRPPGDVYYYGLVSPNATFGSYCQGACIAGLAYQTPAERSGQRVGVGVGFTGAVAVDTLAHELGHSHGRGHAPCGARAGVDNHFPHEGGVVGAWGFDRRSRSLVPPNRRDIMGYCSPRWISDYTFQALLERSAAVNPEGPGQALVVEPERRPFRALLVDGAGRARWGLPTWEAPSGAPEPAAVLDERGVAVRTVEVYRTAIADSDEALVLVPAGLRGAGRLAVAGAVPVDLGAPSAVRPLRPVP